MTLRLAAVVTAYKPDNRFFARFASTIAFCDAFVVVDNTPGGHDFGPLPQGAAVRILQDGRNKGLGGALNPGIAEARACGCNAVALFDQDSSPGDELLKGLVDALELATRQCGGPACVGPLHVDDARAPHEAAVLAPQATAELQPVTCLATSGMVFRIDSLTDADAFTEEFFLDFVDFDWCWRMGTKGWKFFRARHVPMPHRLGLAQRKVFGLTYHVPAPYRHYFQFRDTLRLAFRPYVPLYSKARLACLLPAKALVYPFILDRGLERARWMWLGVLDAIRRVGGLGAARDLLAR